MSLVLKTDMCASIHLHHVTNNDCQNHHKLLLISDTTTTYPYYSSLDCEAPENGLTPSRSFPFKVDLTNMRILSSCNGLICVRIIKGKHPRKFFDLILWNPLTGDYKTLSKANSLIECFDDGNRWAFQLYYNSSNDDYRLLLVTRDHKVHIYSLKSDSWRDAGNMQLPHRFPGYRWPSICFNDKFYFLAPNRVSCSFHSYPIIRFDTETENFTEIAAPSFSNSNIYAHFLCFIVLRGCIHVYMTYDDFNLDVKQERFTFKVWKMEEDGNWAQVVTYHQNLHLTRFGALGSYYTWWGMEIGSWVQNVHVIYTK